MSNIQLPTDPRARKLAKADLIGTLVLRSAAAKGLPIKFGPWDGLKIFHDQLMEDPDYWIKVFDKVKVILDL